MTAVRVHVTQQDIDNGGRGNCSCPVWRALTRAVPGPSWYVGRSVFWKENPGTPGFLAGPRFLLPADAKAFIARYDNRLSVEPFEFDLDVPDDLLAGAS